GPPAVVENGATSCAIEPSGADLKRLFAAVCTLSVAVSGQSLAQEENISEPTALDRLVITTPLRRESALERSTSSVTVIDEEDIRKSAALDLPSLLKFYTGVTVTADGGRGANAGVSLRGTRASQTLVLINGVRIASATSGSTSI